MKLVWCIFLSPDDGILSLFQNIDLKSLIFLDQNNDKFIEKEINSGENDCGDHY